MFGDIFDTKTLYTGVEFNYTDRDIVIIMYIKEVDDMQFIFYTLKNDKEQIVRVGGFPKEIIKKAIKDFIGESNG